MDTSFEDQIRERAYQIWLAGGMADGQAHEHWTCAEQAVKGEMAAEAGPVVIITKAEPKPAKARKTATAKTATTAKPARARKGKMADQTAAH